MKIKLKLKWELKSPKYYDQSLRWKGEFLDVIRSDVTGRWSVMYRTQRLTDHYNYPLEFKTREEGAKYLEDYIHV